MGAQPTYPPGACRASIAIASSGVTGWVSRLSPHSAGRGVVLIVVVVFAVIFFVACAGSWLRSVLRGHSGRGVGIIAVFLVIFSTASWLGSVLGGHSSRGVVVITVFLFVRSTTSRLGGGLRGHSHGVVIIAVLLIVLSTTSRLGGVLRGHSHGVVIIAVLLIVFSTSSRLGSVLRRGSRILRAHSGISILLISTTITVVLLLGAILTSAQLLQIRCHLSMILRTALLLDITRKCVLVVLAATSTGVIALRASSL